MRVRFDEYTLDVPAMQLRQADREIHLSRKAFDLLRILVASGGRVVTKAELHAEVWPDTFVVDTNLNVLVGEVRKALNDSARDPRLLKTVHGVGYRFCADVEALSDDARPAKVRHWLVVKDRKYPLSYGETTIGRDPACDVWLDVPGVSRRHARIQTTTTGDIILEDSNSTNGTYVRGTRVTAPVRLQDGDEILLGSFAVTFRCSGRAKETERVSSARSRAGRAPTDRE